MRRAKSQSSALKWVTKGRAAAPPATPWSAGVSTSTKSRDQRNRRMASMMRLRASSRSRDSALETRSRYRWR